MWSGPTIKAKFSDLRLILGHGLPYILSLESLLATGS